MHVYIRGQSDVSVPSTQCCQMLESVCTNQMIKIVLDSERIFLNARLFNRTLHCFVSMIYLK